MDLKNAGVDWVDEEVVVDEVFGHQPADSRPARVQPEGNRKVRRRVRSQSGLQAIAE